MQKINPILKYARGKSNIAFVHKDKQVLIRKIYELGNLKKNFRMA
jgi:hypothetical protein